MILHENRLPVDDSHEISYLICYFWKSGKICNCRLLQIIGGALRVKYRNLMNWPLKKLNECIDWYASCVLGFRKRSAFLRAYINRSHRVFNGLALIFNFKPSVNRFWCDFGNAVVIPRLITVNYFQSYNDLVVCVIVLLKWFNMLVLENKRLKSFISSRFSHQTFYFKLSLWGI